jgi:hypothetical protein
MTQRGINMANVTYNIFKKSIMTGAIDLDTDTLKVMLVTSSYTPNIDTHLDRADVTNEVTGDGYTEGGVTLTSVTVTQDDTNNRAVFDAGDVSWTTATITARGAVIYKSTGTAGNDLLIAYKDFGSDKVSTYGTFTIVWGSDGILYLG